MIRAALWFLVVQLVACEPIAAAVFPSAEPFPRSGAGGLEEECAKACSVRAANCSERDCSRGCNLVLDRLAEKEGDDVLACVAKGAPRCDDRTWAACAARIGAHADGGPPAPPPAPSAEDREEE